MNDSKKLGRFLAWGVASIVVIYLVILAGAIVRGTGAGMGCPDWPKCFGLWIPPTNISQLPDNYRVLFSDNGKVEVEPFNPIKTWTEYINRLIGALSGLVVLVTLIQAFRIRHSRPKSFVLTLLAFLLLLFQGWVGAKVVSTNLTPHMITYHMLLAMIIVGMLIFAVVFATKSTSDRRLSRWFLLMLLVMFIQMLLGINVREQIDETMKKWFYQQRELWLSTVDYVFFVHRSFFWGVLLASLYFLYRLKATAFRVYGVLQLVGVLVLLVTGLLFQYAGFPTFAQPIHLLTTALMIGSLFHGLAKTL